MFFNVSLGNNFFNVFLWRPLSCGGPGPVCSFLLKSGADRKTIRESIDRDAGRSGRTPFAAGRGDVIVVDQSAVVERVVAGLLRCSSSGGEDEVDAASSTAADQQ